MLYQSIEKLLKEQHKTWTDFLFETKLSLKVISKCLANTCSEEEQETISSYFNMDYLDVVNYINNTDITRSSELAFGINDFSLTINFEHLLNKLVEETLIANVLWVEVSADDKFCCQLPITQNNSLTFINLKDNYDFSNYPYKFCYCTEYKNSKWFVRYFKTNGIILNVIIENKILTYSSQNEIIPKLLSSIQLQMGCSDAYNRFADSFS